MDKLTQTAAKHSLITESESITDILSYMNWNAFDKAVNILIRSDRVMTTASGTSGIAAKKFAHSLCCVEIGAMFMPPCEAMHGGLGALKENDVMIMVSRGGKTAELLPLIDVCKKKKAKLIAVTENMDSPLANNADILLPLKPKMESDPLGLMATSSFIATIAIFDALLAAIMTKTGYTKEQFGLIHPGGAVGSLLKGLGDNHV